MAPSSPEFHDDPPVPPPGTRLEGIALGIDVGGTGVKAALVDLATASLVSDRIRVKTPQPSAPEAVLAVIESVVARVLAGHDVPDDLPVGCGLPGVVKDGRLTTAANIDKGWVGWPAQDRIGEAIGRPTMIINDADAAGLAEMAYGAGEGIPGTVLLLTIGTGIGSALFIDGALVPNTEFGHLEVSCKDAESRLSGAARERRGLGWKAWAREFDGYLARLELYVQPDLFILGGGVSKEYARYGQFLQRPTPIVTARYLNASGIIGAAYAAAAAQRRHVLQASEGPAVEIAREDVEDAAAESPSHAAAGEGDAAGEAMTAGEGDAAREAKTARGAPELELASLAPLETTQASESAALSEREPRARRKPAGTRAMDGDKGNETATKRTENARRQAQPRAAKTATKRRQRS
jgi:polyphosphate glucokinase